MPDIISTLIISIGDLIVNLRVLLFKGQYTVNCNHCCNFEHDDNEHCNSPKMTDSQIDNITERVHRQSSSPQ